jgi:hypothetical protein
MKRLTLHRIASSLHRFYCPALTEVTSAVHLARILHVVLFLPRNEPTGSTYSIAINEIATVCCIATNGQSLFNPNHPGGGHKWLTLFKSLISH